MSGHMRICLIYDCLFPYTVGGGERWLRNVAAELVEHDYEVTYLTRRQWPRGEEPDIPGVNVVAVSPGGELYTGGGRRRILPPILFGLGVFWHLLRHRRRYDVLHCAAFPFFSLLAARLAAPRTELWSDWFEVWTADYWREYLGRVGGAIGFTLQKLAVRSTSQAIIVSQLHGERLREEGLRGEPMILSGIYSGSFEPDPGAAEPREPLVVFAGRHIPEKRVEALPAAIAAARERVPGLRGRILGDGPERPRVLHAIAEAGMGDVIDAAGFVSGDEVHRALAEASCHVLPSRREGYGMVVIEAAAAGTPTVLVRAPDNAAVERIEPGVNGFVVDSLEELPAAIAEVHERGAALRASTVQWFRENADRLSAVRSAREVADAYGRERGSYSSGR